MSVGACVGTDTTICGDAVCPAGTSCAMVTTETGATQTRCVQPGQITACVDLDDRVACSLAGVASATCIGGACFPDACGDGLRGAIEACDDANVTSGDGCASDCRSAEVCGNGIVDPVVLVEGTPAANELCDDGNFLAHDGCGLCATGLAGRDDSGSVSQRARVRSRARRDRVVRRIERGRALERDVVVRRSSLAPCHHDASTLGAVRAGDGVGSDEPSRDLVRRSERRCNGRRVGLGWNELDSAPRRTTGAVLERDELGLRTWWRGSLRWRQ